MFLTNRAEEVKTTMKSANGQSCTSSESVELTLPLERPSFTFDTVVHTANAFEKCPEIDSKELESPIRRCRELETINRQLNKRLMESESQNEEYRTELECLKLQLADALKIPFAMLFPGKPTRAALKNSVRKLQNSASQRGVLAVQLPEKKESGSKGEEGVNLADLEETMKTLESRFVQGLNLIKTDIGDWYTRSSKDANEKCSSLSFDKQRLKEVLLHIKNFTLLVHQNATKLQTLLRPIPTQGGGAFFNAQNTSLTEKESSFRSPKTLLDSPMSSESITVHKSSFDCDLRKEGATSKTHVGNLSPPSGQDYVKTSQNQAPRIPLHAIESKTASLKSEINDSARNFEDYHCFNSSPFNLKTGNAEARLHLDTITEENSQLRREIIRISEELVDVKEHSATIEAELKEQKDASVRCKMTEKNLRRVQDSNRDLSNALSRKQKIIISLKTVLTNLRSEAKQHGVQNSTTGAETAPHSNKKTCPQVDAVLEAERRYSKMERLITTAQIERDCLASRLIALDGQARCLQRKYSINKREMDGMRKENSSLKRALSCARSEIRTLQTNLRVETMKLISRRQRTRSSLDLDGDVVMMELVKTKIALAEMHGVVIELRKEVFKSRSIGCLTRSSNACSSKSADSIRNEMNIVNKRQRICLYKGKYDLNE